jgi:cell division protein FtsB
MLWEGGVELTEKDYQYYYDNLTGQADKRRLELRTGINSKEAALKAAKRRSKNIALKIIDYKQDSQVWKINNDQLSKLDDERKDLKKQIKDLRVELNDPEQELLSIEQFLNLAKNVGSKVKAADEVGEYHICRIIFLNLVVDDKSLLQIGKGSRCLKWSADSYFNRTCFSNSIRSANLLQATSKTI